MKEIREATPQSLHHFTRFDQVNQLVGASEADPDLGFMARIEPRKGHKAVNRLFPQACVNPASFPRSK